MKKIMMLVAAVMLAGIAQAAFVNWKAGNLGDYNGNAFYLFDASKSSDVLSALAAVDDSTASTLSSMAIGSGTVKKGNAGLSGIDVGNTTQVMAVILGGDIADGTSYLYKTEDISAMLYTPPATPPGTFASTAATGTVGTMVKAGGGGGDVPEPTSGLLLLVGGAMLALRRKQK